MDFEYCLQPCPRRSQQAISPFSFEHPPKSTCRRIFDLPSTLIDGPKLFLFTSRPLLVSGCMKSRWRARPTKAKCSQRPQLWNVCLPKWWIHIWEMSKDAYEEEKRVDILSRGRLGSCDEFICKARKLWKSRAANTLVNWSIWIWCELGCDRETRWRHRGKWQQVSTSWTTWSLKVWKFEHLNLRNCVHTSSWMVFVQ